MTAPQPPTPAVACPGCGTLFKWKANLAGRKLKCRCGALMRMPADPTGEATLEQATAPAADDAEDSAPLSTPDISHDAYELELPETEKELIKPPPADPVPAPVIKHAGRCPSCGTPIKPNAIICVNCGLNLAEGTSLQTEIGVEVEAAPIIPTRPTATETERLTQIVAQVVRERKRLDEQNLEAEKKYRFQEFYLPLIMLAGGVIALIFGGIKFAHSLPGGLLIAAEMMALEVFVMMPLLLLAVFLAARVGGIGFGSLNTAILKLAAICIGPGTVADLLMIVIMAILAFSMAGFFVVFAVYLFFLGLPMAMLFDLDMHETSVTVAIAIIIRAVALIFVFSVVWSVVHP